MSDNFKQFHVGKAMHDQLAQPLSAEYQQQNVSTLSSMAAADAIHMLQLCRAVQPDPDAFQAARWLLAECCSLPICP